MHINTELEKNDGKIRFDQVGDASIFRYEGGFFMTIDEVGGCNCVDLRSGSMHHIHESHMVETVSAEIVVKRIGH